MSISNEHLLSKEESDRLRGKIPEPEDRETETIDNSKKPKEKKK